MSLELRTRAQGYGNYQFRLMRVPAGPAIVRLLTDFTAESRARKRFQKSTSDGNVTAKRLDSSISSTKGIAEPRSNFTSRRRQSIRDQKAAWTASTRLLSVEAVCRNIRTQPEIARTVNFYRLPSDNPRTHLAIRHLHPPRMVPRNRVRDRRQSTILHASVSDLLFRARMTIQKMQPALSTFAISQL
jgi:hypothetical protein